MNPFPTGWGRPRDDVYGPYDHSYIQNGSFQHTQHPIVVGTSVVAVMYKDGVVIAADTLASYGSLAKYRDVNRLFKFNDRIMLGFGGDISDMQAIDRMLISLQISEGQASADSDDEEEEKETAARAGAGTGRTAMSANNLYCWLTKLLYRRRSDFNPLWNNILVVGLDSDDKPFLSGVDLLATQSSAPCLATGFGAQVATPILRKLVPDMAAVPNVTKEQAVAAVRECMKVLFYRDARSLDNYHLAVVENSVVTEDGKSVEDGGVAVLKDGKPVRKCVIDVQEDQKLENQNWVFAEQVRGYGTQIN